MPDDHSPLLWLQKLAQSLSREGGDARTILRAGLRASTRAVEAEQGCILTLTESGTVEHAFLLGFDRAGVAERDVWDRLIKRGLIGFAYHSQRTISIRDTSADARWQQARPTGTLPQIGSALGVPLIGKKRHGVLVLMKPERDYFDQDKQALVETMTAMLAGALDSAAALAEAARMRRLFDDTPTALLLTDLRGTILDANGKACSFFGRAREALLNESIMSLLQITPNSTSADRLGSVEAGSEVSFSTETRDASGKTQPVMARARRLKLDGDDRLLWMPDGLVVDEREQLRRDLTAMTYHDLRGPLHNINGSLARLEGIIGDNAEPVTRSLLHVALNSTRQLTRMVKSLLDIERLEEGKTVLDRKPTLITELVAEATDATEQIADDADQKIVVQVAENLPLLRLDGDMIARVITNLIENAIKYTPAGGKITVSARPRSGGVVISVADSGPGMTADQQAQIFDKYTRLKAQGGPGGLGLGLAFCRLAVEAHSGRIWVESEPGKGAIFSFLLPGATQMLQAVS